jgi:hypothetical protein
MRSAGITERSPGQPNRRQEPRFRAVGPVAIQFTEPFTGRLSGKLVDVSDRGFRAAHNEKSLAAGQRVEFEHAGASGAARVIWTRILGDVVESGFLIL